MHLNALEYLLNTISLYSLYNFKPLSDFSFRVAEGHYRIINVFKCLIRKHEDNDLDNKACKPPNGILVGEFLNTYKFYFLN